MKWLMHRLVPIIVLTLAAAGCASTGAGWLEPSKDAAQGGRLFVERACAGCHAVERAGDSPNPSAPAFRTLSERLPGKALDEQLARLSARGHVEMPPIYMTPDEQRSVAAYVRSLGRARADV